MERQIKANQRFTNFRSKINFWKNMKIFKLTYETKRYTQEKSTHFYPLFIIINYRKNSTKSINKTARISDLIQNSTL